jgi:hypothetical protein
MNKKLLAPLFALFIASGSVHAIDFWQYPETAEKHSIFASVFFVSFSIEDFIKSPSLVDSFSSIYPGFCLDYTLPLLPLSVGVTCNAVNPEITSFGLRPAYHINFNLEKLDVYFLYVVTVSFAGESEYIEYSPGIGVRRLFGRYLFLCIETGYKFSAVFFGVAIKLN